MKTRVVLLGLGVLLAIGLFLLFKKNTEPQEIATKSEEGREKEESTRFVEERLRYEYDMLKDPATGKIPNGIFQVERAYAKTLPEKQYETSFLNGALRTQANNTYIPAGPNNIGGRTRAVAYDKRYDGTTNRVIIAGSVSGGILRSIDGGNSWTRVSPAEDIHNLTALAQDPRQGFENTWYAGGGEFAGNTASELNAPFLGFGIWKSINNGETWTKLTLSVTDLNGTAIAIGVQEAFDHPFDIVHRIAVNPINGHVFIAGHRRLVRSTDGGASFAVVFAGTQAATTSTGQMDVAINSAGRIYLGVNGGNPDAAARGLWISPTGNASSFVRIAGGQTVGVDSVTGWRGNITVANDAKRIVIGLAPSNNAIGYVYYENGLSSDSPNFQPEADLFRFDDQEPGFAWSNRSANLPDFPAGNLSGSDPLSVQGGYDMEVAVKPDNPNVVFIAGTNLYRSTDGFSTPNNTAWIGGYSNVVNPTSGNYTYSQYPGSHADIHKLVFNPSNPNQAICGNDGGVQETVDITAGSVSWRMLPNYQTLQCYNVAIDPGAGRNNFASGSQDNGVRFRDATGLLGTAATDSNNHRLIFSADGAFVGISLDNNGTQYLYESIQLGRIFRIRLASPLPGSTEITPAGLTGSGSPNQFGEFVTNFRLESDNTDNIYYVNYNRLFRTINASSVTPSGWTELTGVSAAVNPANPTAGRNIAIRGVGYSRGPYTSSHVLYLGTTNGKIFRLDDPRNAAASTSPRDITPTGLVGNVQDIATNPNNDDEVIAVVSNYNTTSIWWTKNGKSASPTWKNAEGNLTIPSIRSCMIVVKKDAANQPVTEYYVGTSIGLYSTVDLGTVLDANQTPTWAREGGNLLNYAIITSLAYRPVDNVLLVGTHGNGMYYTNIGTPNFTPNLNTGIVPVVNDRNFIRTVFPTLATNAVQYQIGNQPGIRKISVRVINMNGEVVYREDKGYQNGSVPIQRFASGVYILQIMSDDNRFKHVQKLIRQ